MIYDEEHGNVFTAQGQLPASNDMQVSTIKIRRGRQSVRTAAGHAFA